jgi:hypothetical protein
MDGRVMKGVAFEALGERHELRFDFNALCQIEADFDAPIALVMPRIGGGNGKSPPRMGDIRRFFRAGLGADATDDLAGRIIGDLGLEKAMGLMEQALALAFPEAAKAAGDAAAGKTLRRV